MTGTVTGAPEVTGTGWNYQSPDPALSFNVRLGIRTNITLDGTVNPDFSQVEADVGQILSNQRFALFFPEKRPFFLEGTSIYHGLSWYGGRGATVERWTTSLRFAGWWNYDGFWDFEDPTEAKFFFGNAFTLRGGWTGSVTLAYEQTQWDPGSPIRELRGRAAHERGVRHSCLHSPWQGE